MKTKTSRNILPAAMAAILFLSLAIASIPLLSADDTPPTEYYTYSPTFISTASDAESVRWDFGDGVILDSRDSGTAGYAELLAAHGGNVWAPRHTYANNGSASYTDYTIIQTVYNSYEGGSEDTYSSTIRIMGPPVITFVTGDGTTIAPLEVPKNDNYIAQRATAPDDPTREGYTFEGWFTDVDLTKTFSWSTAIGVDTTLYASWKVSSGTTDPGTDPGTDPDTDPKPEETDEGDDDILSSSMAEEWAKYLTILLLILGILAIIYGILRGSVYAVGLGVILIILCIPIHWFTDGASFLIDFFKDLFGRV